MGRSIAMPLYGGLSFLFLIAGVGVVTWAPLGDLPAIGILASTAMLWVFLLVRQKPQLALVCSLLPMMIGGILIALAERSF